MERSVNKEPVLQSSSRSSRSSSSSSSSRDGGSSDIDGFPCRPTAISFTGLSWNVHKDQIHGGMFFIISACVVFVDDIPDGLEMATI